MPVSAELRESEGNLIQGHKPIKAYLGAENKELLRLLQKLELGCYRLKVQLPATSAPIEKAMQTRRAH